MYPTLMKLFRAVHRQCVFLLCLVFITPAFARVDAMELRLLEAYQQDLRWDNIESDPEWINGIQPEYSDTWGMHRVRLAPNQQVTIILPAYESLRLYHPKQALEAKELEVYVSNGTGLAVKQTLQRSSDGHSLVLSPHASTPLLIHIARGRSQASDVEVALFVSRKVPIAEIAPYRNLIWSTAQWCLLGQEPLVLPELYNQLTAQQQQSFNVTGPARIALKNRLHYERAASELRQDYRIRYWLRSPKQVLDAQELNFSTSVETSRVITVNTAIEVVGREEQAYIEIPEGQHKLVLEANRDLYIQVLAQTEDDYLFPSLNNPRLPVEEVRKQGLLPTTELALQAQQAKRIAQDNNHQAGGMVANHLLRDAALKREDYPEGLTEAEQLRGFSSFYRDLLPSKKIAANAQFMAYFIAESLHAINRPQSNAILADQHLADALKRVSHGYFTELPNADKVMANEYSLPEQYSDGQLRLIVDKRQCVPRQLRIEIDQKTTKDIQLRCATEREPEDFTRSLAETALIRLQQEEHSDNVSLDALFSQYLQPAPLINTAVYELPLTKGVHTIKIWQTTTDLSGPASSPVNIAVQYRASKQFLSSEQTYLARLHDVSGKRLNVTSVSNKNQSPTEQQLHNEWLPLQRLLQAEYRLYKSAVTDHPTETAAPATPQLLATETTLANSAEQKQQWLEALEHWGKVVNYSQGLVQQQAQLAQARALTQLGENYLAENLRRYLSLIADVRVAEPAITELAAQYQAQNNNAALQTLAAAMFIHRPSPAHNRLLLDALLKNGEYHFTLLLGLSLGKQAPPESLLTAAYRLAWWQSYQHLLSQLPPDKQAFWIGLQAQQQGDITAALKAWSGTALKSWHDYLQQGLQLRDHLIENNGLSLSAHPMKLYEQWSQWQQQNPSAKTWQNALWHIKDYAGSDSYYAIERDVIAQGVRATVERPVSLGIMGPVMLNLQVRPLHPPAPANSAIDGWLQITDNHETSRYPYTNNQPVQGLMITGADAAQTDLSGFKNLKGLTGTLQAGSVVVLDYQVGQGWHEIQLSSEQAPLSINIQEQRPEFALSILPTLQMDTFAEMVNQNMTASPLRTGSH